MKARKQAADGRRQTAGGRRQVAVKAQLSALCLRVSIICFLLPASCLLLPAVSAQYGRPPESSLPQGGTPEMLKAVGIEQRLNNTVPLDLLFRDEAGREVRLGEYFGKKPVVISLVYYNCPMLCNQVLDGLV
ncbi:MAG: hypothetical protein M3407_03575, partial [Acidobacteriota bacterium]|nr:hypothetical protein [Acidobacteriota bacterium]